MLKREITYESFDGEKVTEVFYFNISKPELIELEVEYETGVQEYLEQVIKAEDKKKIVEIFKKLVLLAYGERSEDGKHFVKSPELSKAFSFTAAYPELFMELATDAEAAAVWVKGVLPSDLSAKADEAIKEDGLKSGIAEALGTSKPESPTT